MSTLERNDRPLWRHPGVVGPIGAALVFAIVAIWTRGFGILDGPTPPFPAAINVAIEGETRDRATKQAIEGVTVKVWPIGKPEHWLEDKSRSSGEFIIEPVQLGRRYDFLATHPAYIDHKRLVTPKGIEAEPGEVLMVSKGTEFRLEDIRLGPRLANDAILITYDPLLITIFVEEIPTIANLEVADVKTEILLAEFTIRNEGSEAIYLDLGKTFFNGQFPESRSTVPYLVYDYWASALVQQEMPGPVLRIDFGQEVTTQLAFTPLGGPAIPTNPVAVFPSFWASTEGSSEGFAISPPIASLSPD